MYPLALVLIMVASSPSTAVQTFVIVDTSVSMEESDPDRLAVLGAQLVATLRDDTERVYIIKLASTEEFCSGEKEVACINRANDKERVGYIGVTRCVQCDYDKTHLTNLASGDQLVVEVGPDNRSQPVRIRQLLGNYQTNATVYKPSLDAVSARLTRFYSPKNNLILLTDGRQDDLFHPPSVLWPEGTQHMTWKASMLIGDRTQFLEMVDWDKKSRVNDSQELLLGIAKLYASSHQSTILVKFFENGKLVFNWRPGAVAADIAVLSKQKTSAQVVGGNNSKVLGQGHNGYGLHYQVIRVADPKSTDQQVAIRSQRATVALIMQRYQTTVELEPLPEEVQLGTVVEVSGRVLDGAGVKGLNMALDFRGNVIPVAIDADGGFSSTVTTRLPGKMRLQAILFVDDQEIGRSPSYEAAGVVVVDGGTIASGTRHCVQLPLSQGYIRPGVDESHSGFVLEDSWGSELCYRVDLWTPSALITRNYQVQSYDYGDSPIQMSFRIERTLGPKHFLHFLPLIGIWLYLAFQMAKKRLRGSARFCLLTLWLAALGGIGLQVSLAAWVTHWGAALLVSLSAMWAVGLVSYWVFAQLGPRASRLGSPLAPIMFDAGSWIDRFWSRLVVWIAVYLVVTILVFGCKVSTPLLELTSPELGNHFGAHIVLLVLAAGGLFAGGAFLHWLFQKKRVFGEILLAVLLLVAIQLWIWVGSNHFPQF